MADEETLQPAQQAVQVVLTNGTIGHNTAYA